MKIRGQTVYPPCDRITRKSIPTERMGCWEWAGVLRNGYGRMISGSRTKGTRKSMSAHRFSYEAFVGAVPDGLCVLHRCDNRRCVNPEHLFLGTKKDNTQDMLKKGRWRNGFTGPLSPPPGAE